MGTSEAFESLQGITEVVKMFGACAVLSGYVQTRAIVTVHGVLADLLYLRGICLSTLHNLIWQLL